MDIKCDWFQNGSARRKTFLESAIPETYSLSLMSSDMAPRFYYRVKTEGKTFVLMESAPDGHPQALVGHEIGGFLSVQASLSKTEIRVPQVIANNAEEGLVLLEDFGDTTFEAAIKSADDRQRAALYEQATHLLFDLKTIPTAAATALPVFQDSRIYQFGRRFADWFLPFYYGRAVEDTEIAAYFTMMQQIEASLPDIPFGFVHGDFQPPNMMVLEDGSLGLLDFQGALFGPPVYDLVNLLHDARRNVDDEIIRKCQKDYFSDQENDLMPWYHYLSLHFHLRCIGQFIRVAVLSDKPSYLDHLDRLRLYLNNNPNPVFKRYCKNAGLDFDVELPPIDIERVKTFIRTDAS